MLRKGLLQAHKPQGEAELLELTGVGRTGRPNPIATLKRVKTPAPEAALGW